MAPLVFVGWDPREVLAYQVCCMSLQNHTPNVLIQPISRGLLGSLYQRPTSVREGIRWDDISNAPMTTDFSIARFFVPFLAQRGLVVFCDCDFLWRAPLEELLAYATPEHAVHCVQHDYTPAEGIKMDRQPQVAYPRKNWSSMVLWNLDHAGNRTLVGTPHAANHMTGAALHRFAWLPDEQVGELPLGWNWLEGVSPDMSDPMAVHFTRGTPNLPGYEDSKFADEWRDYASRAPQ